MVDSIRPEDERRLAERLRCEAEAQCPEFSELLHRRIVDALGARQVEPRKDFRSRFGPRTWLVGALVASVAIVATVAISPYLDRRQPPVAPQPKETAVVPPDASQLPQPVRQPEARSPGAEKARIDPIDAVAGGSAETVGNLVDATLTKSQWAYLDHDARVAADLVLAQLPLDLSVLDEEVEQ